MTKAPAQQYYLYIDDSGSRLPDGLDLKSRDDGMDHFALGGVLVAEVDKLELCDRYFEFCKKWKIDYPLHSTKIRGMRDNFAWLEKSSAKLRDTFYEELSVFLESLPVIGFATVIHRPGYNERYKQLYGDKRWLMCKTAYSILIERVAKYLQNEGGILNVRFEGAGKKEDRAIIQYAKDLKHSGMPFHIENSKKYGGLNQSDFQQLILGEPRRKTKENLYVQLADLYLYPMAKRKYEPTYNPWVALYNNKKVIDALLPESEWSSRGIKYSCFDDSSSKKPEQAQV